MYHLCSLRDHFSSHVSGDRSIFSKSPCFSERETKLNQNIDVHNCALSSTRTGADFSSHFVKETKLLLQISFSSTYVVWGVNEAAVEKHRRNTDFECLPIVYSFRDPSNIF